MIKHFSRFLTINANDNFIWQQYALSNHRVLTRNCKEKLSGNIKGAINTYACDMQSHTHALHIINKAHMNINSR